MARKSPGCRQRNFTWFRERLETRQLLAVVQWMPDYDFEVPQNYFSASEDSTTVDMWQDREVEFSRSPARETHGLIVFYGNLPGPVSEWAILGSDGAEIPGWNSLVDWDAEYRSLNGKTWGPAILTITISHNLQRWTTSRWLLGSMVISMETACLRAAT